MRGGLHRAGAVYLRRALLPLLPGAIRNVPVAGGRLLPGPPRAADADPAAA
ncbi:unannotated protein [freshwater metagenome]|uniref:Unannotated protein n=1 Tax=freshwater metagenome TaxID=449393 RepID=A0A6J7CSK8_9ZZZZ